MKFKAKPKLSAMQQLEEEPFNQFGLIKDYLDEEGYVHGWYVDGYIVGKMLEANEEYCVLEFWCPIDKSTLAAIGNEGSGDE